MKAFRFNLQAVQTWREHQEQMAEAAYAEALRHWRELRHRLIVAEDQLAAACFEFHSTVNAGSPASRLAQLRAYCRTTQERRDQALRDETAAEARAAAALQSMLHARRQREILDHYRDRQRLQHDRELQREERKELDEIASRCAAVQVSISGG